MLLIFDKLPKKFSHDNFLVKLMKIPKNYFSATFTEGNANTLLTNDAKMNLLESGGIQTTATTQSTLGPPSLSVGNHLDIPQSNPNLLSPDMLNQRRGSFIKFPSL